MIYDFWQFQGLYNEDEVKNINKFLSKNFVNIEDRAAEGVVKTSAVEVVQWGPCSQILAKLEHCVLYANRANFHYDVHMPFDMMQTFNHNTYSKGQEYGWHADRITEKLEQYDIKLTCILNLSERNYTGGDLYIRHGATGDQRADVDNDEDMKVEFGPGSAVVFAGGLFHKVSPVKTGTRISLTTWIEGPKWK